jgi:hypothetical protein
MPSGCGWSAVGTYNVLTALKRLAMLSEVIGVCPERLRF